ncbi:hypothetical protein OH76DRAFT_904641 [Lentinus brumalis]|uniref:BTB domain-containing protein n=1 Tax=Lentinus brumalis TaxID=2498619 RepID=A0A371D0E9_9APHY|nr:hypothetical protein OH76DRAFT_904641 [Polyporus brumalis]
MAGNAFRFPDEKPVFEVACAIVRLGHKYEFDAIASKGLAYLTDIYLSSWLRWAHRLNLSSLDGSEPVLPTLARSISVMNIARITDTPSLLLPALVECCNMEFHELMAGYQREDGVLEHLSADDLACVVRTRTEMVRLDALAALRIFRGVSAGCTDPALCNQSFQDALWSLTEPGSTMTFRPLERDRHWADYAVGCSSRYKFCEECKQRIRSQASSERMKIWDLLPSIFGWPELPGHCWMGNKVSRRVAHLSGECDVLMYDSITFVTCEDNLFPL